jgi:hypothetical protein
VHKFKVESDVILLSKTRMDLAVAVGAGPTAIDGDVEEGVCVAGRVLSSAGELEQELTHGTCGRAQRMIESLTRLHAHLYCVDFFQGFYKMYECF